MFRSLAVQHKTNMCDIHACPRGVWEWCANRSFPVSPLQFNTCDSSMILDLFTYYTYVDAIVTTYHTRLCYVLRTQGHRSCAKTAAAGDPRASPPTAVPMMPPLSQLCLERRPRTMGTPWPSRGSSNGPVARRQHRQRRAGGRRTPTEARRPRRPTAWRLATTPSSLLSATLVLEKWTQRWRGVLAPSRTRWRSCG